MKLGYLITLLFFSVTVITNSQTCFDFSNYDNNYLQDVINDDNTYPIGQSFMSENYVDFIKPNDLSSASSSNNDFCYMSSKLAIAFNNTGFHEVDFYSTYHPMLIVDGDTIYQNYNIPTFYTNNQINFYHDPNTSVIKVNGKFDTLTIVGSTNCIQSFCYEEMNFASNYCFDFSDFNGQYLDSVLADQTNYPYGSVFMGDGPIEFIKQPNLSNTFGESDTSFCSIGNYQIAINQNLIDAPFELTFDAMYIEELIVDQDTVFSNLNIPNNYSGSQFDFEYDGNGNFTLSGDFDTLTINTQTNCISNLCIRELPENSYCFDFAGQNATAVNDAISDDVNYPIGSVFMSDGDIEFIKTNFLSPLFAQGDTSFCYIGDMVISVANAADPKTLSMYMAYAEIMIIDGDTIFNNINPPANYSNNNINFSFNGNNANGDYVISGSFDTLIIEGQTNCISDLCLEEGGSVGIIEQEIAESFQVNIFPNPYSRGNELKIEANNVINHIVINDISGQQIIDRKASDQNLSISLDHKLSSGIYIVNILNDNQWIRKKLIVK